MVSPAPTTPRSRRNRLRLAAAAAAGVAVVALTLSGCVSVKSFNAQQQGAIGAIDLVVTGCGSKAATPGCELGSTNLESNATSIGQVLLGVQMDSRFVPPASFTTDIFSDQQPFTASPSYTAELTRLDPPGAGRKWAGYISDARTYTPGKLITAHVPIIRPLLPDGSPNPSGFGFGWKIGSRGVLPEAPATRPVACGADLATVNDLTICADGTGRGRRVRLQRLRLPDPGAGHGPTRPDGDRPDLRKAHGTREARHQLRPQRLDHRAGRHRPHQRPDPGASG